MTTTRIKNALKWVTPPAVLYLLRKLRAQSSRPEWEYAPQGWPVAESDPRIKGWNEQSILDANISRWPAFVKQLSDTLPFGISPEAVDQQARVNLSAHNLMMTYGYALSLAAGGKSHLSMLDWGGGIGQYYLISKALRPDLDIEYTCKDLQLFTDYGQTLLPETHFYSDETWKSRRYEFVLVSSSLQYSEDWRAVLTEIANVTSGYLFVTRLPTIHEKPSYVMVQRPYQYGYNTEYLGWCLNRQEILDCTQSKGLTLVREFVVENAPYIQNAPEQCDYWGFLFKKL